jgi:hypothetical protein
MSPVTNSFFSSWGSFDLSSTGEKKENFASIAIDFCKFMNVDPGLVGLYEKMQASRMGIYKHEGSKGGYVFLTELITHKKVKVIIPVLNTFLELDFIYFRMDKAHGNNYVIVIVLQTT